MKTFLHFIFLINMAFGMLAAQADKGTYVLSGTVTYRQSESIPEELSSLIGGSTYTSNFKQKTINFLPRIGYFVNTTTAVGIGIGYQSTIYTQTWGTEKETIKFPRLVIEPYVRFYKPLSDDAFFFIDGAVHFKKGTDTDKYTDSDYPEDNEKSEIEVSDWGILMRPGFVYKFAKRFAMEISIGKLEYSSIDAKPKGAPSSASINNTNFIADFSLKNVTLGIEWYLSK